MPGAPRRDRVGKLGRLGFAAPCAVQGGGGLEERARREERGPDDRPPVLCVRGGEGSSNAHPAGQLSSPYNLRLPFVLLRNILRSAAPAGWTLEGGSNGKCRMIRCIPDVKAVVNTPKKPIKKFSTCDRHHFIALFDTVGRPKINVSSGNIRLDQCKEGSKVESSPEVSGLNGRLGRA